MIQVPPHNGNGDESRDEWREVDSAEEGLEANELRVEQKCGGERDCDCQWPADKSEIESVLQCLPEIGSVEELAVIVQADEASIGRIGDTVDVEVSNAEQKRSCDGEKKENADQEKSRRQKKPRCGVGLGWHPRANGFHRFATFRCCCWASSQRRFSRSPFTSLSSSRKV